ARAACMSLPYSRACIGLERSVSNSEMSLPGEKALPPAPRNTMQRTPSSAASAATLSPSMRHIGLVIAFSLSGRFKTSVAMAPSRSTRRGSATRCPLPRPSGTRGHFLGRGALPGAREIVERPLHTALLVRHAGERQAHLDARERARQHEVVEIAEVADAK